MDRLERLRQDIAPGQTILEIGPYFNPIAPRAAGYRTTTLDVFPTEQLRQRAAVDPHIPRERVAEIEEVDLVGSACDLADLAFARYGADRRFDWILSSHNIEHIPNPVRFLSQCAAVLRPEGVLRLAIPDKRFCFDHFRPLSETSEWLEAFFENRDRPTAYQVYREESHRSTPAPGGAGWTPTRRSLSLYREWFGPTGHVPAHYVDTHCWAFTPESFELIVRDMIAFGLVPLRIASVSATCGIEFYVDLARPAAPAAVEEEDYYATRERLLRRCVEGEARSGERPMVAAAVPPAAPPPSRSVPQRVLREARRVVRQVKTWCAT